MAPRILILWICLTTGSYFAEETPVDRGQKGSLLSGPGLDAVANCRSTRKLVTVDYVSPLLHSHINVCTDGIVYQMAGELHTGR